MASTLFKRARTAKPSRRYPSRRLRVEPLEQRTLLSVFSVTNLGNSGGGSLRGAIQAANANVGPDTIEFAVAGTVNLTYDLPALSDLTGGTKIDGTTAPGYSGVPVVVLRGAGPTSFGGLQITSPNNEVRALQIGALNYGILILGETASGNVIAGNYIGTDGSVATPN